MVSVSRGKALANTNVCVCSNVYTHEINLWHRWANFGISHSRSADPERNNKSRQNILNQKWGETTIKSSLIGLNLDF